jgi:DNA-binding transcriptional MerR regulator
MEAITVSAVTRQMKVSTRMLRYYEQLGLIRSFRRDGYAYRMYDENAVARLRQILILRKLRIPLKQIQRILQSPDAAVAIDVFRRNIAEADTAVAALTTIRNILQTLVERLEQSADVHVRALVTEDEEVLAAIASLVPPALNDKEGNNMEQLNSAEEALCTLTDVRIVYLPPATVAAAHVIDEEPEAKAGELLDRFVRESGLAERKPDLRHYGFNHPNPKDETGAHGYEMWVTIPEEMQVPAPLTKKHFAGGMYAAHMIPMGNFQDWEKLICWAKAQEDYQFAGDWNDQDHMCGLLEENLNYLTHLKEGNSEPEGMQLDLLLPLRRA